MYQFEKLQDGDGEWRFELNGINLLLEGFSISEDKHWIKNPLNAIGFFSINGNLYGIANDIITYKTAEEFYDTMQQQYSIFKKNNKLGIHPESLNENKDNSLKSYR